RAPGRMRRFGSRPGRCQLRGVGHAPRGARSRSCLRGNAAGQTGSAYRLAGPGNAVQVSDSSSRILGSLLEARTGQQLTMSRRWRIETALQPLMRERGLSSLDGLVAALVARNDE